MLSSGKQTILRSGTRGRGEGKEERSKAREDEDERELKVVGRKKRRVLRTKKMT